MAFSGPVEDRLAIHELVASYADAVSRRDADAWGLTWAEDAVWHVPEFPGLQNLTGRETIVTAWSGAMENFTKNYMSQNLGAVDIQGDRGTGTAYNHEVANKLDGSISQATGRYEDEYIKLDGTWFFAKRVYYPLHGF